MIEFNENYLRGYMVEIVDVGPQLGFWSHLVCGMVENTFDEETESREVDGIRLRASMGDLGEHEIVTARKYCGKLLVYDNKWRRVKQTYQKQKCTN